jgi:integrase/recombinase XerC
MPSRYIKFDQITTATAPTVSIPNTMAEATKMFLDDRERKGLSLETRRSYRFCLATFPQDAWPLTPDHLQAWQLTCEAHGHKPVTIRTRLVTFRTFWNWLRKRNAVPVPGSNPVVQAEDPSAWIDSIKVPKTAPRIPTPNEVWAILKACDKYPHEPSGKRLRAMIRVLIDTALRIAELTALKWQDVDWEQGQIIVWHGKGDKPRIVPFNHGTLRILRKWFDDSTHTLPGDYVFPSETGARLFNGNVFHQLHRLCHLAGIGWGISAHKLRHYAATEMLRHEMPLEQLRMLLGHTSMRVTERYLHLAGVDVKKAHRRASPGDWLDRMIDRGELR